MLKVLWKSCVLVLFLAAMNVAWAQWPPDPAENLIVSNMSGEETISEIAPTSDGGCYVSWWNNTSGMYCFYLQRYNSDGVAQWADDGLLISDHIQDTWLTDYGLAVDSADHAIITINDLRAGGDWDIYAYRISPAGAFVWGRDGLTISDNSEGEYIPRAIVTANGNIIIAWQGETAIHIRRIAPDGSDLGPVITHSYTYPVTIPSLAIAGGSQFIVQMLVAQGPYYYSPKYLYAQKYDDFGNAVWAGPHGVVVQNAGGFGPQMRPEVISDGAGGAYSYWYDSRDMNLHAFAQHILSDGSMAWTTDGVVVSTTAGHLQMNPTCVALPAGNVMLFYVNSNSEQTQWGLYGQMIDATGTRQWGSGGIAFEPLGSEQQMLVYGNRVGGDAVVAYLENTPGSFVYDYLKAIRVDVFGNQVWDPSPVIMATSVSEKGYLSACANGADQVIAVWQDKRMNPSGDIYLQNINSDGTFGPAGGLLTSFDLISPADSSIFDTCYITFVWQACADPLPGHPVSYEVIISPNEDFSNPIPSEIVTDTSWYCPICLVNDPSYYWKVRAFNDHAPDRYSDHVFTFVVEAENPGCAYVPGDIGGNGQANGIDVVYGVAYLKGGTAPVIDCNPPCSGVPDPFFAAMDVNGNCAANGIDITYYVAYLKGLQPALRFCADCPPAGRSRAGL